MLKHLLSLLSKFRGNKLLILCLRFPNLVLNNCLFVLKSFLKNENFLKYCIYALKMANLSVEKIFTLLENCYHCSVKLHDLHDSLRNC